MKEINEMNAGIRTNGEIGEVIEILRRNLMDLSTCISELREQIAPILRSERPKTLGTADTAEADFSAPLALDILSLQQHIVMSREDIAYILAHMEI